MSSTQRYAILALVSVATLAVTLPVCFFAAMWLAGPHSDVLPAGFPSALVMLIALVTVVVVPCKVTSVVRRRLPGKG
ncbi:MAG: hypothetical protein ACKV22_40260 [Bryobacteraceae bacterium]